MAFKEQTTAFLWLDKITATISLTTMEYGVIYPVSTAGQIITMLSLLLGIAIVALPVSIITTGYIEEVNRKKEGKQLS